MRIALLVVALAFGGAVLASADPADLDRVLEDLTAVEAEMTANQVRIEALQAELGQLKVLGAGAESEIGRLQALVEDHSSRVQQLGDRYATALTLAQRQKAELDQAARLNWVLGGTAVVLAVVVVAEGAALAGR